MHGIYMSWVKSRSYPQFPWSPLGMPRTMTPFGGLNTKEKKGLHILMLATTIRKYLNFERSILRSMGPIFTARGQVISCHPVDRLWSRFDTNTKSLRWVIGLENTQECWGKLMRKNFPGITVNDSREFSKNLIVRNFARTGLGLIVDPQVKSAEHFTKSISNWAAFCGFS